MGSNGEFPLVLGENAILPLSLELIMQSVTCLREMLSFFSHLCVGSMMHRFIRRSVKMGKLPTRPAS